MTATPLDLTRTATLSLTPEEINENGGTATVTATLDRPLTTATTLTVSTEPVAPTVAEDFEQTGTALTIPAGKTASTGVVTLTAVDNDLDAPDRTVGVTARVSNERVPSESVRLCTWLRLLDTHAFPKAANSIR